MVAVISQATQRNWERLNVVYSDKHLIKRANKTNSRKRILPLEYFSDTNNLPVINTLLDEILTCGFDIFDAMYSIVINCFNRIGIVNGTKSAKANVQAFMHEYSGHMLIKQLLTFNLPTNETDLLGLIYQSLYAEGDKNKQGLYYTPAWITKRLTEKFDFSENQTILDPCCGSGSFLLNVQDAEPTQLYGVDCDPIAVMLCKANLIMRYKELDFIPQVFLLDYLAPPNLFDSAEAIKLKNKRFDYVFTNPPWGAVARNTLTSSSSGEAFSRFLSTALESLISDGVLVFLLPESVLNVKTHSHLRSNLLENYSIECIELLPNLFAGVTTKAVALTIAKKKNDTHITVYNGTKTFTVNPHIYKQNANHVFSLVDSNDKEILDSLYSIGQFSLSDSTWALGIVTGNNADKLSDAPLKNGEPIYTGKEIRAFKLRSPKKHIIYDRSQFQQVAKDEIYRAKEKLVYKFISNKLVFAYDGCGSLFLNSANILIPHVPSMSILSVLLLLNSEIFQFAYLKQFGEVKILKGNLCELPFPQLSSDDDCEWTEISNRLVNGDNSVIDLAQETVYQYYGISVRQINYIKETLGNGTFA